MDIFLATMITLAAMGLFAAIALWEYGGELMLGTVVLGCGGAIWWGAYILLTG